MKVLLALYNPLRLAEELSKQCDAGGLFFNSVVIILVDSIATNLVLTKIRFLQFFEYAALLSPVLKSGPELLYMLFFFALLSTSCYGVMRAFKRKVGFLTFMKILGYSAVWVPVMYAPFIPVALSLPEFYVPSYYSDNLIVNAVLALYYSKTREILSYPYTLARIGVGIAVVEAVALAYKCLNLEKREVLLLTASVLPVYLLVYWLR